MNLRLHIHLWIMLALWSLGSPVSAQLRINEIDANSNPGADTDEFIELFNGGPAAVDLGGVTLALYRGDHDAVYFQITLTGSLAAGGYAIVQTPSTGWIRHNGTNAVALYAGAGPAVGDAVTTSDLLDAVVYGSHADPQLNALLLTPEPWVEVDSNGSDSIQRCPNGGGVARSNAPFSARTPTTRGAPNSCPAVCGDGVIAGGEACDAGAENGSDASCCTSACAFRAAGEVCRESAGACDAPEVCAGDSESCPTDLALPDGADCDDDSLYCNGGGSCMGGVCAPVTRECAACAACSEESMACEPIPGCCTEASECDDADPCTEDRCQESTCAYAAIPGCGEDAGMPDAGVDMGAVSDMGAEDMSAPDMSAPDMSAPDAATSPDASLAPFTIGGGACAIAVGEDARAHGLFAALLLWVLWRRSRNRVLG